MRKKMESKIPTLPQDPEHTALRKRRLWVRLILAGILLFGLILRILYLREIADSPDFSLPQLDAGFHDYWARGLATGDWTVPEYFSDPEIRVRPYMRPPGYPFFLALVYTLFGCNYLAPRIIQMGLGLVNCLLAYFLGKILFRRGVGLIFAALMSVYWAFIYFEGELVAPVLLITLALTLMHIFRLWCEKFTFWRATTGGAFLGLFALVRPNILLFAPAVLGWSWWVARRRNSSSRVGRAWLGFLLGLIMMIAPATVRNYLVAHDFVLITSPNAGLNLYIGNNEEANGIYSGIPALEEIAGQDRWSNFDYPKIIRGVGALQGREMKHSEVSAYFTKKAIDFIRSHPARFLRLLAIKTALFWGPEEVSNNKEIHFEKLHSPTLRHIPGFPAALSLAIVGLIPLFSGWKRQRKQSGALPVTTQRQFEISVLILLFVAIYFISFLPFFVAERFRVPIIPFLFLFGSYGLYRIGQLAASHDINGFVRWVVISIALYIMASIPLVPYKPNPAEWHFSRGIVYSYADQLEAAIEEFRETIKLDPDFEKPHITLGLALAKQGKMAEAIHHYSEALRIKPSSVKAHNNLGAALAARGAINEAVEHYSEALRIRPDVAVYNNLGLALATEGKIADAIHYYSEALQMKPDFVEVHNNLGLALAAQGRITEAMGQYSEALRIKPDYAKAHNNLGLALAKQGKTAEAIRHFSEALQSEPNYAKAHNNLGLALAKQGRTTEAIQHFSEALRIEPDYVNAHNNVGFALAGQGRIDEAISHYSEALRIEPDSVEAHNNLAAILARKGKIEAAIFHLQEALRLRPGQTDTLNNLNKLLAAREKVDEAVMKIQNALKDKPEDPVLHYRLGNLYEKKGEWDKAIDHYQKALAIQPTLSQALNSLAIIYATRKEYDKALSFFKRITVVQPDNAGVYYNIACIYARQDMREKSIDWLKKAVEKGYKGWDLIKTDKDLESIRDSSYYKELVKGR
jgi:tetratricopeptide (TPR) repeat protein/4-amino-4-deoxy-L-arabinose transferase-like glycosyltransferase